MSFEEIKKQAISQWKAMQGSPRPRILIGTATCGMASGAEGILEALNKELAKNNVTADIVQVGCIGLCFVEPLFEVVKPGQPVPDNLSHTFRSEVAVENAGLARLDYFE